MVFSWFVFFATAIFLIGRFDELVYRLPTISQLLSTQSIVGLVVTLSLVKILHELGHALACRRCGGDCFEIGVILLAFIPTLYCNVTDAWTFPEKWKRLLVSYAGIHIELWLACLAAIGWFLTEPGLVNAILFNVMLLCSLNTLLINWKSIVTLRRILHPFRLVGTAKSEFCCPRTMVFVCQLSLFRIAATGADQSIDPDVLNSVDALSLVRGSVYFLHVVSFYEKHRPSPNWAVVCDARLSGNDDKDNHGTPQGKIASRSFQSCQGRVPYCLCHVSASVRLLGAATKLRLVQPGCGGRTTQAGVRALVWKPAVRG